MKIKILVFILIISAVCICSVFVGKSGDTITITSDGEIIFRDKIANIKEPLEIDSRKTGYNKIIITQDGAKVTEADCPDKLCIEQSKKGTYPIVCLPHKLVIEKNR